MSVGATVRRMWPEDVEALVALRREALEGEPLAFGSSPEDDRGVSPEIMRESLGQAEYAVFGHFEGDRLAGMVGVHRAPKLKVRHKAYLTGMYVAPAARGRGAGRALLEAAIEHVRGWAGVELLHLSVTTAAPAATRLYESAGFRPWGLEPRALQSGGTYVDEIHLILELGERHTSNGE